MWKGIIPPLSTSELERQSSSSKTNESEHPEKEIKQVLEQIIEQASKQTTEQTIEQVIEQTSKQTTDQVPKLAALDGNAPVDEHVDLTRSPATDEQIEATKRVEGAAEGAAEEATEGAAEEATEGAAAEASDAVDASDGDRDVLFLDTESDDPSNLSLSELRARLRTMGLSSGGKKGDLVQRLKDSKTQKIESVTVESEESPA